MLNFFKLISLDVRLKYSGNITSYCNNSIYAIFCCSDGSVHIITEDLECITFQISDKNVEFCCIIEEYHVLITLCQVSMKNKILLKTYSLGKHATLKKINLISSSLIESNFKATALTAVNTVDCQLSLAIGLENGGILYCKSAAFQHIAAHTFKSLNICDTAIRGIEFSKNNPGETTMFVCSDVGVYRYNISNNLTLSETKLILDDMVSSVHCCTLKPSCAFNKEEYFVVARDDGLYCYTGEGRGPCYAINGFKQSIRWLGRNIVMILKANTSHIKGEDTQLIILDVYNKIVVLNKEINNIMCILPTSDRGNSLIYLKDGSMFSLREIKMKYKLKHLISKNFYEIAVRLLEDTRTRFEVISNVLVLYGDHLMQRGDITGAVRIFSKTIGTTPPFLIINKLMNFRHNVYLIQYLSKLVGSEYKTPEHVELLMNCYQRIELPSTTFRIFEMNMQKYNQLYINAVIMNWSEKISLFLEALNENSKMEYFLNQLNENEVIEFFSEYGYCLMNLYPSELEEAMKYLSLNRFLEKEHIFYRIIIPLLLINKLCAVDFFNTLNKICKLNSIYTILAELILQTWQKGNIDIHFVIQFFKIHDVQICTDSILTICRSYEFWPGIKIIYDKYNMEIHSTRYLMKCYEKFALHSNELSAEYTGMQKNIIWIRTLNKRNFSSNYAQKYTSEIFRKIINIEPYSILKILSCFMTNHDYLYSHLNEFLPKDIVFTYFKCDQLCNTITVLEERVNQTNETLSKYLHRPIEFRNRSCEICKQILNQPILYFLCQHSYHKECIRKYSESVHCIACGNVQKSDIKIKKIFQLQNPMKNDTSEMNLLQEITDIIRHCVFNQTHINRRKIPKLFDKNILPNPIKETKIANHSKEYDDNLNPFVKP